MKMIASYGCEGNCNLSAIDANGDRNYNGDMIDERKEGA